MAKKRKGSHLPFIASALIVFAVGIILMAAYGDRLFPPGRPPAPQPSQPLPAAASREIDIYFSAEDGKRLAPERRKIKKGPLESELSEAVRALIAGPASGRAAGGTLEKTLPAGTRLLSVDIKGSTAYVDLSGELKSNHPGGSSAELQTIYSVVNTLTLNFPEITAVQLLADGERLETLAGHILIAAPLGPDRKMIKK